METAFKTRFQNKLNKPISPVNPVNRFNVQKLEARVLAEKAAISNALKAGRVAHAWCPPLVSTLNLLRALTINKVYPGRSVLQSVALL